MYKIYIFGQKKYYNCQEVTLENFVISRYLFTVLANVCLCIEGNTCKYKCILYTETCRIEYRNTNENIIYNVYCYTKGRERHAYV